MGRYSVSEEGRLLFDSREAGRGKASKVFDISAGAWKPAGSISAETWLNSRPISEEEAARVLSSKDAKTVFKLGS